MKFNAAYTYLKSGHKIKLPEWGGYWHWDTEKENYCYPHVGWTGA